MTETGDRNRQIGESIWRSLAVLIFSWIGQEIRARQVSDNGGCSVLSVFVEK